MAISFDAVASNNAGTASTPLTWTHTCNGQVIFVFVYGGSTSGTVTSVTFDGAAMSQLGTDQQQSGGSYASLWYLVVGGTHQGAKTVSAAFTGGANHQGASASYTRVSSVEIPNSPNVSTTSANSITTIADNCWVVGAFMDNNVISAGAGTTLRTNMGGVGRGIMDSGGGVHPAGSYTLNDAGGTANWLSIIASMVPANTTFLETQSESESTVKSLSRPLSETQSESEVLVESDNRWSNITPGGSSWSAQSKSI